MKATCPNNPNHKKFITVIHVAQDAVVDEHGNFLHDISTGEMVAGPNKGNTWQCAECQVEAKVTDE